MIDHTYRLWSLESKKNLLGIAFLVLFLGTLPLWLNTPYALSIMILIGIYSIVIVGLCLLMGYAGQVSLGQAAFFGLGAYGSAILSKRFGWSPWLGIVGAAAISGTVAYLIGIPVFRLQGHYLAMGTLAFGAIVHILAGEWKAYTGGATGLPGVPRLKIWGQAIDTDLSYYYLVWGFALVGLVIAVNVVHSRFGRALCAIRDSEAAAASLGVEVSRHKLKVLVVSAIYASVAGSLYVHYMIFVSPSVSSLDLSIRFVLMAAVGGLASVWGAPFGTALVMLITVPLITKYGSGEHQIVAYGILLVVIMIFMPHGLSVEVARAWEESSILQSLRQALRGHRK